MLEKLKVGRTGRAQGCWSVRAATLANQELPPTYRELTGACTRAPSERKGAGIWCKDSLGAQGHFQQVCETLILYLQCDAMHHGHTPMHMR